MAFTTHYSLQWFFNGNQLLQMHTYISIVSGHQRDPKHAFYKKREWNGGDLNRQPFFYADR